jgi:hypothetical protein
MALALIGRIGMIWMLAMALSVVALGSEGVPEGRQLAFTTQDSNGFHMITVLERDGKALAAVWRKRSDKEIDRREAVYPSAAFEKNWKMIFGGALDSYKTPEGTKDLGVAGNYVVALRYDGENGTAESQTYLIPKCGAPEAIVEIVKGIALDLLPEGSPGLFKPC